MTKYWDNHGVSEAISFRKIIKKTLLFILGNSLLILSICICWSIGFLYYKIWHDLSWMAWWNSKIFFKQDWKLHFDKDKFSLKNNFWKWTLAKSAFSALQWTYSRGPWGSFPIGTIPILRQQKGWVCGIRKMAIFCLTSVPFMLT